MKQIPLLQGKVILIELPEGVKDLDIFKASYGQQLMCTDKFDCGLTLDLPSGKWRIIGMLSELTEEQVRQIARHRKHNTIRDGKLAERLMFYNHTTNIYGQATASNPLKVRFWQRVGILRIPWKTSERK